MSVAGFIIWNGDPVLFSVGRFVLQWHAVLIILGLLLARKLLGYLFKAEGCSWRDAEVFTYYLIIGVVVGARLGYVCLFQPSWLLTRPLEVVLPISFTPGFHITGLSELSAHGALIGVVMSTWIFSRTRSTLPFVRLLDRLTIPVGVASVLICIASFVAGEFTGKPTNSSLGVFSSRFITDGLTRVPCCIMRNPGGKNPLDRVSIIKDTALARFETGYSPVILYLFFQSGATEQSVNEFLIGDVKSYLYDQSSHVYEPGTEPLHYTIFQERIDVFTARIRTIGIARHATSLYEGTAILVVLAVLWLYSRARNHQTPQGRITGIYISLIAISTIGIDFLKQDLPDRERPLSLALGQLAWIPFLIAGLVLFAMSFRKSPA
jgi:prolipoprotein diacylglyceryltransferase